MDWSNMFTDEQIYKANTILKSPVLFAKEACELALLDYQKQYVDFIDVHQQTITLKARQTGITSTTLSYLYWYACSNSDKTIIVAGNTQNDSITLVEQIRTWLLEGPSFFSQLVISTNKSEVRFANGSRIIARAPSSNNFRGFSCNIIYLDEFAFVKSGVQKDLLDNVLPCLATSSGKLIISTTPNTVSDEVYLMWNSAQHYHKIQKLMIPYQCRYTETYADQQRVWFGPDRFKHEYECEFIK